jgi:hypothetical protein
MAKRLEKSAGMRRENSVTVAEKAGISRPPLFPPGRDWLWGSILGLVVVLVYLPVWNAGFIWDDPLVVTANPVIVGPLGLGDIWTTRLADICPFTLTTFWLEHALWGLAPAPYHVVNILFHAGGAIVLWRVLRRLLVPGAWLGAALWALHPLQVQSAAWIAEMKNTESGLFFLLAILFFLRWRKARESRTRSGGEYALTLLFAALALASKSSTVILPVVLGLSAWWTEGRWRWRNLVNVALIFAMAVIAGLVSLWTQGLQLAAGADPQWARSWPERIADAGDAVWFYLGKLIWPHPLIFMYPRWQIDASRWTSYLPLLAVIVVLGAAVVFRFRLFRGCAAAGAGAGRQLHFPVLARLRSLSIFGEHGSACAGGGGDLSAVEFRSRTNFEAAIGALCGFASGPCRPELAASHDLQGPRDSLDRYAGKESRLLGGLLQPGQRLLAGGKDQRRACPIPKVGRPQSPLRQGSQQPGHCAGEAGTS